jgi:hypothetical protein
MGLLGRWELIMKHFLIKYRFRNGSKAQWHEDIGRFISALENDPALRGKITYMSMKVKDSEDYYHLATAEDEDAVKALGERDFFSNYTKRTEAVAGGDVEVLPLEVIAETKGG